MGSFDSYLLHLVVFIPLLFALLVAVLPKTEGGQFRVITLIAMVIDFILGLWVYLKFDPTGPEFQLESRARWLTDFGLSFHLGVDGLSVSLLLLTVFLGPLVVLGSASSITTRVKEFHIALLVLQTAMLGALVALDVLLFYVFFEAMLIPMYLLVGVWGSEDRVRAAVKFFLYTLVGSLLMLVAILGLYFITQPSGARSFDYATIYNALIGANRELGACMANEAVCGTMSPLAVTLKTWAPWMFFAFALAFAIKVPMWPVHTWLPDAHVQAPVAGSMILAGVMLKMGTYGFWRFAFPLFPGIARDWAPYLGTLSVIGIVYGALMCLAQRDIKKLIAYSSVSHLGFCMLGMVALTAEGATGSAYQMLNHGVSTGALFLLFGYLYERRHTRLMSDYGGIARVVPVFTAFFLIITFSSIAVPGTNGFVGEFLVLLGSFKSKLSLVLSVFAATGVILGAAYMLWMVQKVFFGGLTHRENQFIPDLSTREILTAAPFLVMVFVMGLHPQPFLDVIEPSTRRFIDRSHVGVQGPEAPTDERVRMKVMALAEAPAVAQPYREVPTRRVAEPTPEAQQQPRVRLPSGNNPMQPFELGRKRPLNPLVPNH